MTFRIVHIMFRFQGVSSSLWNKIIFPARHVLGVTPFVIKFLTLENESVRAIIGGVRVTILATRPIPVADDAYPYTLSTYAENVSPTQPTGIPVLKTYPYDYRY